MDFKLSDEQVQLQDSVMRFGAEHYPAAGRFRMLAAGVGADRGLWRKMAELGWLGLSVPNERGGIGGDDADVMVLMNGFGRHLMLEPYATTGILAGSLLAASPGSLSDSLLCGLMAGTVMIAPALAEPDAGFDLHRVTTVAERMPAGYRLTGTKNHAEDGASADWFIVPARTSGETAERDGISLFLVHRDSPHLVVERFRSIDHHGHARLRLDGVTLDGAALVGPLGGGLALLEAAVDRASAAHLAEAVGSMDALRDMTLSYLKTRHQFGAPIGSFQVLQHRMVDIEIACEEARSMVYHATLNLRQVDALRRRAVSAAKARVGQCALFVGRQAIQLHGGIGVSAELIVSHHLKRLMMIDLAYGNAEHHKALFANAA